MGKNYYIVSIKKNKRLVCLETAKAEYSEFSIGYAKKLVEDLIWAIREIQHKAGTGEKPCP